MSLLADMENLKSKRIQLAEGYENDRNYGLAFIAYWSVVEFVSKQAGEIYLRKNLRDKLQNWLDFLDNKGDKPSGKGSLPLILECKTIPQTEQVESILGELPQTKKLLDTRRKFRKKRNSIAHHADSIKELSTYEEYKSAVLSAIEELSDAVQTARL